jgi:hypothetical protein
VSEQAWLTSYGTLQPMPRPPSMAAQGLIFPIGPLCQFGVNVPQGRVQSRLVVSAVVVNPAPDYGVEHPGEVIERFVTSSWKCPRTKLAPYRLEGFVANRGTERDTDSTLLSSRQPRSKRITEEVELLVGIVSAPVIILTVDDLRLLGMKHQPTFSEPLRKHFAQPPCLRFAPAVADRIVGITFEGNAGMIPAHPRVERIVQKEVSQQRTDYSALWRSLFSRDETAILHLDGCIEPSLNIEQHPRAIGMFTDRPHQQIVLDAVERTLDTLPTITSTAIPNRCGSSGHAIRWRVKS